MPTTIETAIYDTSSEKFSIGKREYQTGPKLFDGDCSTVYACAIPEHAAHAGPRTIYDRIIEDEEDAASSMKGILKIASDELYNVFLENEARILLTRIYPKGEAEQKFYRYFPRVLEHFRFPTGRVGTIMPLHEGFVTMQQVKEAFPTGLDFRDHVWMFKRTLVAIGFAHQNGVVHGGVLPTHVMVHPEGHGAKLIDWTFSVQAGDHIKGISSGFSDYYPPEVFDKMPAGPGTDIYMAAKSAVSLLGGNIWTNEMPTTVPARIQAFFLKCLVQGVARRPNDAWALHDEFEDLLKEVIGPPEYRLLVMPT